MEESLQLLGANYFVVQRRAFKFIGFELREKQLRLQHPLWAMLLIFCILTNNWCMMVDSLLNLSDLIRFTDSFATVCQGTVSTFKLLVFIFKRQRIGALVQRMHSVNSKAAAATPTQRLQLQQQNILNTRLCRVFRILTYGNLWIWALIPIVTALVEYLSIGIFQPMTPMEFNFWLDEKQPIYYWPIYIWSMLAICSVVWVIVAVDTLFFWLVHNVVGQLQLLRLKLSMGHSSKEHLVQCVQQHSIALELAQELDQVFAEIMFVQYMLSYLLLCSITYRFSRGGWSPQVPFRAGFLVVVFSQLSAYCFAGDYIKQQSSRIATDIYSSFDWPKVPPASRRFLLLMTMRAQQPSKVSGYMFNIDRPLLLWVLKTTGSFLAMLRTFER